MAKTSTSLAVIVIAGLVLVTAAETGAARKGSEVATRGPSSGTRAHRMSALHARLSAVDRPTTLHTVELSGAERDILAEPGLDSTGRYRVGVHRSSDRPFSQRNGDVVVRVPGAPAVRLELAYVAGKVSVFNDSGEAHEYERDGFTHVFPGSEVRVRGTGRIKGAGAVNLGGNLCDFNASCTENAECVDLPAPIASARGSLAMILFFSRGGYYVCSGGLVADSTPASEIPYFLTANHCVSRDREARSVLAYFNHVESSCVGGTCPFPSSADTSGASLLATNRVGDYTLLVLDQAPPPGSVFLGWNTSPVAFTEGAGLYRISHPGGAPQAFSQHSVDTGAATCGVWPRGDWIYSRDTFGATEGGSSGSPVLNADAEVVGQLSGACGFNVDDECDAVANSTVDGAFSGYYPQIQQFLGSGDTCSVDSDCDDGDFCTADACQSGTCANTALSCDDGDACTADTCEPSTGQCSNAPLSCDDGDLCTTDTCDPASGCVNADMACPDDGDPCTTDACNSITGGCESTAIDCDDGIACTIDGCDASTGQCFSDDSDCTACALIGESCASDSACCGEKCRGKPGDKTCR